MAPRASSSSPSPKDWADSLCSAITTWSNSVKTAGQSLKSGNLSKGDLKKATSEIKAATNTFADDLKGLGKPNTDAGQQAKDAIDKLAKQVNDDVDQLQSAVNDAVWLGHDEERRDRRLEHRHHALDDEHADRLGRFLASAGRREGRARAGLPGRPGLQEAQLLRRLVAVAAAHARDEHGDHRHQVQLAEERLDDRKRSAELVGRRVVAVASVASVTKLK